MVGEVSTRLVAHDRINKWLGQETKVFRNATARIVNSVFVGGNLHVVAILAVDQRVVAKCSGVSVAATRARV